MYNLYEDYSFSVSTHLSSPIWFHEGLVLYVTVIVIFIRFVDRWHHYVFSRRPSILFLTDELLFKLWSLGVTGPLWQWFRGYLLNRKHFVCMDDSSSSCQPVLSGVPQGSILGPLLFHVYVNDIPSSIHNSALYLVADDTKFVKGIGSSDDDINSLLTWCSN